MSGSRAPSAVFVRLAGVDMRLKLECSDGAGVIGILVVLCGRHANMALRCKGWAACGSWVQTDAGARGGSIKGRVCTGSRGVGDLAGEARPSLVCCKMPPQTTES